MYQLHMYKVFTRLLKWIMKIENTLSKCSLGNVWENQHSLDLSFNQFKKLIKDKLVLFYKNQWLEICRTLPNVFSIKNLRKY